MKTSVIQNIVKNHELKVGISLALPTSQKEALQSLSEKYSVSINAIVIEILSAFLKEDEEELIQFLNNNNQVLKKFKNIFEDSDNIDDPLYLELENILNQNQLILKGKK